MSEKSMLEADETCLIINAKAKVRMAFDRTSNKFIYLLGSYLIMEIPRQSLRSWSASKTY